MQRRNINVSSPDAYFFQLLPLHFRVQHAFAKNVKSGTTYRLSLNRGVQKLDDTTIKAKIIQGKISFDPKTIAFNQGAPSSPRITQYIIKILQTKPGQEQKQIALHKFKSSDFVQKFKENQGSKHRQDIQLLEGFTLVFDIFVHNDQQQLSKIVKANMAKEARINVFARTNQNQPEIKDNSRSSSRGHFSRRRGRDGKLKSRSNSRSRSGSPLAQSRSRSSKRGRFPHNQQNQHFIKSPKKSKSPQVEGSASPRRYLTDRMKNLVENKKSLEKDQAGASNFQQKVQSKVQNSPKATNYQSKVQPKAQTSPRSPGPQPKVQSKMQNSPKASSYQTNVQSKVQNSPRASDTKVKADQASRKTDLRAKVEQKVQNFKRIHDLQLVTDSDVFIDLQKRGTPTSQQAGSSGAKGSQKIANNLANNQNRQGQVKQQAQTKQKINNQREIQQNLKENSQEKQQTDQQNNTDNNHAHSAEDVIRQQERKNQNKEQSGKQKQNVYDKENRQNKDEALHEEGAERIQRRENESPQQVQEVPLISMPAEPSIPSQSSKKQPSLVATKLKPVTNNGDISKNFHNQRDGLAGEAESQSASQKSSDVLFYVIFVIVSALLFWNAVTPSRKV